VLLWFPWHEETYIWNTSTFSWVQDLQGGENTVEPL